MCHYKTLCVCVQVFAFHLSGTFSRDFPYPALVPGVATQRERRGEAGMTDSVATYTCSGDFHLCREQTQPTARPSHVCAVYHYILAVLNYSRQTQLRQ